MFHFVLFFYTYPGSRTKCETHKVKPYNVRATCICSLIYPSILWQKRRKQSSQRNQPIWFNSFDTSSKSLKGYCLKLTNEFQDLSLMSSMLLLIMCQAKILNMKLVTLVLDLIMRSDELTQSPSFPYFLFSIFNPSNVIWLYFIRVT